MALEGLSKGIFRSLGFLKSKRRLDEEELRDMTKSLRRALQEADFNVRQTKEIVERLESRMREEEPRPGITLQTHAMNILYTELVRLLGPSAEFRPHGNTLLLVGLYGQGKTTTTAKLAEWSSFLDHRDRRAAGCCRAVGILQTGQASEPIRCTGCSSRGSGG